MSLRDYLNTSYLHSEAAQSNIIKLTEEAMEIMERHRQDRRRAFESKVELFLKILNIKKEFLSQVGPIDKYNSRDEAVRAFWHHCSLEFAPFFKMSGGKPASHVQRFLSYMELWDELQEHSVRINRDLNSEYALREVYSSYKNTAPPRINYAQTYSSMREELQQKNIELKTKDIQLKNKDVEIAQLKARIAELEASRFRLNRKAS